MMIPTLTDYYETGYIPRPTYRAASPFFPNCNLAIRRKIIDAIGMYDENCRVGEDADICRRITEAGWELFYENGAICHHEARANLWELARQWLSYGYDGGHFFQGGQTYRCEVYLSCDAQPKVNRYIRLIGTNRSPFRILVFLSYFSLFHSVIFLALLSFLLGWHHLGMILTLSCIGAVTAFFLKSPLRSLSYGQLLIYAIVTYVINLSCIMGGLAGGLKKRMLYFYSGV